MGNDRNARVTDWVRREFAGHESVERVVLFGSRARGDNQPDSDVDLLVEVPEENSFSILNLIGVEHAVSDNLGLTANAVMRRSLRDSFRASIKPDIVDIF